jgi:hypothetical protein
MHCYCDHSIFTEIRFRPSNGVGGVHFLLILWCNLTNRCTCNLVLITFWIVRINFVYFYERIEGRIPHLPD